MNIIVLIHFDIMMGFLAIKINDTYHIKINIVFKVR